MASTPAVIVLDRARVPYTVHSYDHDPNLVADAGGYGAEAASALDMDPARVFKTLLVQVDVGLVVALCPVNARLDLKAVAQVAGGKKASMASPDEATRVTGYVVGGISPLGQKKRLRTVIDESARLHATVLVSAGRRGLDLELAPGDLVQLTAATLAPIRS